MTLLHPSGLCKPNLRMGDGFAKFESAALAVDVAATARVQGMLAEMARSTIITTGATDQRPSPVVEFHAQQQSEPPWEVDMRACVGTITCGLDEAMLPFSFQRGLSL